MKEKNKVGRPQLAREEITNRLAALGWELPETIKYKGSNKPHTLVCTTCGYITERLLHNVIGREEKCPMSKSAVHSNTSTAGSTSPELIATISKMLEEKFAAQQELILSTAMQRDDVLDKFNKLYGATVSRKGYLHYERQMTTNEWFDFSHEVAVTLLHRLDPTGETSIMANYLYHRDKNPTVKPEKTVLSVLNKTQLFKSLEQLQMIKVLL